jgi:hypothetical protein
MAMDTSLTTCARHQPSGRRSFPKQRTVNPPIAPTRYNFYGYDEGDMFADVTFESHPPTGPVVTLLEDEVFIGEDDNSGGGSEAGLDARRTYRLDFTGVQPHPAQGFHVKLTINAEGSQGADVKQRCSG